MRNLGVGIQYIFRPTFKCSELTECRKAQRLTRHRAVRSEEIIHPTHSGGELGLAYYPAATKSAQTVAFCETACNYEPAAQRCAHRGGELEESVAIDFVHENVCSCAFRDLSNLLKCRLAYDNSARVVRARYHQQPRS